MELYTRISLPSPSFSFSHRNKVILLGSCFVENIGYQLEKNKFEVDINPFGTLYNPASISLSLRMLMQPERFTGKDLFTHEESYHSFTHHSRFSSFSEEECLTNINNRLEASSEYLRKATRLVITFGTSYVYRLKSDGKVVANCHKLPEKMFTREMLSVDQIVSEWRLLLLSLWEHNPKLKALFTVSPIRHWKDGARGNQISKAILLVAIDRLQKEFPDQTDYFPAYEIMMDELRDYRFYAEDMIHPSSQAIDYIWERFAENNISEDSRSILKEWNEIQKAINHKPFQPESEGYKQFIMQTLLKVELLSQKMPSFDVSKEIDLLKSKLNER